MFAQMVVCGKNATSDITCQLFNQILILAMLIGTFYINFNVLDHGWGSQGQQKTKIYLIHIVAHFLFRHACLVKFTAVSLHTISIQERQPLFGEEKTEMSVCV